MRGAEAPARSGIARSELFESRQSCPGFRKESPGRKVCLRLARPEEARSRLSSLEYALLEVAAKFGKM